MSKTIKFSKCSCKVTPGSFDVNDLPLDCAATWKLISSGYTVGVFQLEQQLGQDWSKKVRPQNIQELAILTAVLRPGSLEAGMSQDYVDVKFGKSQVSYLHPTLKPILEATNGCLIYQENAIRMAVEIAGFALDEADNLRKAIGKKNVELMAQLKDKFITGCQKTSDVPRNISEEIFGWIEKSQRYSFNLSHAISYGMLAYQTSWLKTHFPNEFFTSYLTYSKYKSDPKEEIYRLVQDARLFGIKIFAPDIRRRNIHFELISKPEEGIAFGLGHIKGVGQSAVKKIIGADSKSMSTWPEFLSSVPGLHRNVGIALIKSGACDCYELDRCEMIRQLEVILGTSVRDNDGKKQEIKGLTAKERVCFFQKLESGSNAREILLKMGEDPDNLPPPLKSLKKTDMLELVDTLVEGGINTSKMKKDDLVQLLTEHGYASDVERSPCANASRRAIMLGKASTLEGDILDTNFAKAEAEKHFLGISLSCSAADDANDELATHTCLDIARAKNKAQITTCAVIESVRHTKTKRGRNPGSPMCFLSISDSTYAVDRAVVFPNAYPRLKAFCKEDLICLIYGEKRNGSFIISDIQKLI